MDLKTKSEDDEKTKEYLNKMMKNKYEECKKLEQEVTTLKSDLEKSKKQEDKLKVSSSKLD